MALKEQSDRCRCTCRPNERRHVVGVILLDTLDEDVDIDVVAVGIAGVRSEADAVEGRAGVAGHVEDRCDIGLIVAVQALPARRR